MSSLSHFKAPPTALRLLDSVVTAFSRPQEKKFLSKRSLFYSFSFQSFSPDLVHIFLSGACGEEKVNILSLRNGSSTTNQPAFISDWTAAGEDGVCLPKRQSVCLSGAAMGCQALHSEVFLPCHAFIPVQIFLTKCEEQACEESDACEVISAYARLCRQRGVCVDWRSPHLCRKLLCASLSLVKKKKCFNLSLNITIFAAALKCPSSMEYDACRTGCVEDCDSIQALPSDWSVARSNESCMDTPTEGCFCAGGTVLHHGRCVSPEACGQCVDQHGHTYTVRHNSIKQSNVSRQCKLIKQKHMPGRL